MKIYIDTSVAISLADILDIFHSLSVDFINTLIKHEVECVVSAPLVVELGKIIEIKGMERCLDIINTIADLGIHFRSADMKEVWDLSQTYLDNDVLTVRHRLDLFHYATASLLHCSHLASWNSKHFNDKIAMKINKVNAKRGLLSLIVGKPNYIIRREEFG
ncbi:MAG: hypothetical protein ACRD38_08000 [Nitrososphaerales archaeon]